MAISGSNDSVFTQESGVEEKRARRGVWILAGQSGPRLSL